MTSRTTRGRVADFWEFGINFASCRKALTTSAPVGISAIACATADVERDVIPERVLAGMEFASRPGTKASNTVGSTRAGLRFGEGTGCGSPACS
jgi:hypothetical protein